MGLLDGILGPAVNVATNAVATHDQAALQAKIQQRNQAIQDLLMQHQIGKEDSETAKNIADAGFTNHRNQAPVLGEPGYQTAEAGVAGAKAAAELPSQSALEGQKTTAASALESQRSADELAREQKLIPLRIAAQANSANMGFRAAQAFNSQSNPLTQSAMPYAQAKTAFAQARAGNPAALKSSLIAYASVADPKAQLRQGVMNYVTQVDPSFHGTFEMALDRLTSGRLPPGVIDNMEKMVDQLHQTHAAMYDQRRQAYLSRVPAAEPYIPTSDAIFSVPGVSNGGGGAGGGADQRAAYDAAAAALKASGASASDITAQIGARP